MATVDSRARRFGLGALAATAALGFAAIAGATTSPSGDGSGSAADPTILVSTGFELGDLGGATDVSTSPFVDGPMNVESKLLDNLAIELDTSEQVRWRLQINPLPSIHYFAFEYAAEELGAVVTHFFDSPTIKRTDIPVELGRHHVEIFHDIVNLRSVVRVDGVVRTDFAQILNPDDGPSRFHFYSSRVTNQFSPPGNSRGVFEFDNYVWKVGVDFPGGTLPVPEPGTALLLGLGLAGLASTRTRR